jgi:hypothetical protein
MNLQPHLAFVYGAVKTLDWDTTCQVAPIIGMTTTLFWPIDISFSIFSLR